FERIVRAPEPLAVVKRLGDDATVDLVIQLADEVPRRARSNLQEARRLARAGAMRAHGHVQSLGGRYRAALSRYAEAVKTFTAIGADIEVAITDSGSL